MIALDQAHLHPARIDLILLECADRANCKVFYGFNLMMQPWACYYFEDSQAFEAAHQQLRMLTDTNHFETMESMNRNQEKCGGVIYVRRPSGNAFYKALQRESRTSQLNLCLELAEGLVFLHQVGGNHGALDEDNVILDEVHQKPVIQEFVAEFESGVVSSPFRAPEQYQNQPPGQGTDVYQFAAGYLSQIRAPSRRLNSLIERCMCVNPEDRPSMSGVHKELKAIVGSETMANFWPNLSFSWLNWVPYLALVLLLGFMFWERFSQPEPLAKPQIMRSGVNGEKVLVDAGNGVRSFAEFANALTIVTGKQVTYPSSLATRKVINPNPSQKWEEVLSEMGLHWEIQIVKAKPALQGKTE